VVCEIHGARAANVVFVVLARDVQPSVKAIDFVFVLIPTISEVVKP
jgi:hypothetical protein